MTENRVHQEVDGIVEEDNQLPNWWLATFFGAIIFAYGYWQYFHVWQIGQSPAQEFAAYQETVKQKQPAGGGDNVKPDVLLAAASGPEAQQGAQIFAANCAACHGNAGEGKIGPNLTDSFWLHNGDPVSIHTSIANGYPLKGMPAWKAVLGTEKVTQVTAYVLSLKDKNIPGKPPEGEAQPAAPGKTTSL
ncbi:MAG: c-type cytochrome [Myxococcota bacterium]